MRNFLILFGILILSCGCSKGSKIVKSSEEFLLSHLGDPDSYQRIEWKVTDTIFFNDIKMKGISDSIQSRTEQLNKLEERFRSKSSSLEDMRYWTLRLKQAKPPSNSQEKLDMAISLAKPYIKDPITDNWSLYEFDDYIRDSLTLKQSIMKSKSVLDDLEKSYDSLKTTRKSSPLEYILLDIRFRAKIGNSPPLTYKSKMEYDYDNKTSRVIKIKFDGVENKLN